MEPVATVAAIDILFKILAKTVDLSELIQKARNENRDITEAEWEQLDLAQTEAHNKLRESIEQRKKTSE